MSFISGTKAGDLLDSQMPRILALWDQRKTDPRTAALAWTGFGVTLTDNPTIVYFFGSNIEPPPHVFTLLSDSSMAPIYEEGIRFQSIPPLRRPHAAETVPHAGTEIDGIADDRNVNEAGTLGAFLTASDHPQSRWALSANHVIAFNGRFTDLSVVVPARSDLVAGPPVGPLILASGANLVDAAIVPCASVAINPQIPNVPITSVTPATSTAAGTPLVKMGFGIPEPVKGALSYFAARLEINFNGGQFEFNRAEFADQWVVRDGATPFANPGDSGALVVAQTAESLPFGLLIAVQAANGGGHGTGFSVVTPFQNVLSELSHTAGANLQLDPTTVSQLNILDPQDAEQPKTIVYGTAPVPRK